MSNTNQSPTEVYSNTDAAIYSKGKSSNNRGINHNSGSRSKDQPINRSLASFTYELLSGGGVLGTFFEQSSMKDNFNIFCYNLKIYILRGFGNLRNIIIIVRDIKDTYAHVDMANPINLNK